MQSKKLRRVLACVSAVAILACAAASPVTSVSAGQLLGETSFDYKVIPWHIVESAPAKQVFTIEDGSLHVKILKARGVDGEAWDLQLRYRNLDFKAGNTYKVSFKAKAKRAGMQLCSKISSVDQKKEYFVIKGDKMQMGPHMGGEYGKALELTTEYQTVTGTFKPTEDLEGVEWKMHYANGTQWEGNAQDGDEIWFDDMSIVSDDPDEEADPNESYGVTNRDYSASVDPEIYKPEGKLNNFISVNQLGYYPQLSKVAVLGDNKGDFLYGASSIDLTEDTYDFDVCDKATGKVMYSGKSGSRINDADSHDTVFKLDFSNFTTPGEYYIKVGNWRSFPFRIDDDIYSDKGHDILTNAMNYFYQNRSGIDIEENYITSGDKSNLAHGGSHKTDTASVQKIWKNEYTNKDEATGTYASSKITASGGWYDAGDYGKYVVNGGTAVWTLQNMYERAIQTEEGRKKFADSSGTVVIPEAGNKIPDVLDEAAYELDWMAKMKVSEDEPTWGEYAGLYFHKLHDHKWTGLATRPWEYEKEWSTVRIVKPPTFAATLNYAACAAQAARLWKPYDSQKAATYLKTAIEAYQAYEKNWYPADDDEETNPSSLYAPKYQAKSGSPYGDYEVRDEAYWAACEIFVSAKEMGDFVAADYYKKLCEYNNAFEISTRILDENNRGAYSLSSFSWNNTAPAGSLTLALHKDLLPQEDAKKLEDSITDAADIYIDTENKQGYGIPFLFDSSKYNDPIGLPYDDFIDGYKYGSNAMVVNNAIIMAYAFDQTHDVKYINGVTTAMDYLLGTNPLSFSYITGYGTYYDKKPYHKYWAHELDKTLPMAPDGVLSGGPNASVEDTYIRSLGLVAGRYEDNPSQRCFVDSVESWSTNEASLSWNSQLAWVVSFLQDEPEPVPPPPPVTTTFPATEPPAATSKVTDPDNIDPGEVLYGDIDLNGSVDISDLIRLSQHLLRDITLTGQAIKAADCDGNGLVDITDLPRLRQYIMKDNIILGPKK